MSSSPGVSSSNSASSAKNWVKHAGPSKPSPYILLDSTSSSSHAQSPSLSDAWGAPQLSAEDAIKEIVEISQRMLEASKKVHEDGNLMEESVVEEAYKGGCSITNHFSKDNITSRNAKFDEILHLCSRSAEERRPIWPAATRNNKSETAILSNSNVQELGVSPQSSNSEGNGRYSAQQHQGKSEESRRGGGEERGEGAVPTMTTRSAWKAVIPISNEWTDKSGGSGKGKGAGEVNDSSATVEKRGQHSGDGKNFLGGVVGGGGRSKGGMKGGNSFSLHNDPQFLLNMEGSGFLGVPIPPLMEGSASLSAPSSSLSGASALGGGGVGGAAAKRKNASFSPGFPHPSHTSSFGQQDEADDSADELTNSDSLEGLFGHIPEGENAPDIIVTCIRAKDHHLFERVSASLWVPEPIARYDDGSLAGRWDPTKDDDNPPGADRADTVSATVNVGTVSSGGVGKNLLPAKRNGEGNRGAVAWSALGSSAQMDNYDDEGSSIQNGVARKGYPDAAAFPSLDRSSRRSPPPPITKTFRVPFFPFGGGVTVAQLVELSVLYGNCSKRSSSRHATKPCFISENDFRCGNYSEIAAEDHKHVPSTFRPESLYDFVVEVEKNVQFDPVKARIERQKAFQVMAQEKKVPAILGTFNLKVIMNPTRTGFEEERNFPISRGVVVADRYRIMKLIAKSTFSRTVRCEDLLDPIYDMGQDQGDEELDEGVGHLDIREREGGHGAGRLVHESSSLRSNQRDSLRQKQRSNPRVIGYREVCLKIIHNTKDFFDQSLDEIRLLRLINDHKDPDEAHVLRLIDAFYYKEHCMLVTELLSDNLYEYSQHNRHEEDGAYFTLPRLQLISRQIMEALAYVHSLNLIHADLKPENILFVSHKRCIVKVVDFGSSSFLSDYLSSYIQSRFYRAPEVIFGCDYDGRIDVWSFGAILMELIMGEVLFVSSSVPEMLSRMVVECGSPFPRRMLWEGRYTHHFLTKFGALYEVVRTEKGKKGSGEGGDKDSKVGNHSGTLSKSEEEIYYIYSPHPPSRPPRPPSSPLQNKKKDRVKSTTRGANEDDNHEVYDFIYHHEDGSFVSLRKKMVAAGVMDFVFADFVEQCLNLNHKKRWTSQQLLEHPFIRDIRT